MWDASGATKYSRTHYTPLGVINLDSDNTGDYSGLDDNADEMMLYWPQKEAQHHTDGLKPGVSVSLSNPCTSNLVEYLRIFSSSVLLSFVAGVFGADQYEVKSVSVMEGGSVTLDPDLTQIKQFNLIEWRFGDPVIAQYDGNDITYPSHTEIFRDRLQLDQTGSLTIMNMKTKHSGLYRLEISHSQGTSYRKFNVTVYESTSDAGKAEMKSMSLIEGNPVTLQTDVPQLYGDELIVWRFGDEGKLIAKVDIEAKSSPLYYDERFRDRLELENKTGSLIITNSRTTDSGLYTVKISSNKQKFYQTYFVTISGE
ncbi:Contactin-3 [Labeo rohita]|uniref:Contactin-3 n=2 Tax=Labeo rohita TaxID=84645 RepID=A0ABQ8LB96_LABRO|nr:Contactin-3 [Labeo rohita]